VLKTNTTALKQLHLFDCSIGDQGAIAIAEALRVNGALTHLIIEGNRIGDDGAAALARALRVNAGSKLTTLHISENNISPQASSELLKVGVPVIPNAQDTGNMRDDGRETDAPKHRRERQTGKQKPIASLRRLQRKKRRTIGREESRQTALSVVY
jgi:hypothetical protein